MNSLTSLRIDSLSLSNFRCFSKCKIAFENDLTVLVAENGEGKSAILQAAGIAMGSFVNFLTGTYQSRGFGHSDIHFHKVANDEMEPALPSSYRAKGTVAGSDVEWHREILNYSETPRSTSKGTKTLREHVMRFKESLDSPLNQVTLPLVASYGTGRLWREQISSKRKRFSIDQRSRFFGYADCFSSSSPIHGFLSWYIGVMQEIGAAHYATDLPKTLPLVNAVRNAVREVLEPSGWDEMNWSPKNLRIVVTHKESGQLPIEFMSDGVQSMIALVADIARYPIIILDEFQDTSAGQWAVMENLGSGSTLIALADEEQRIYDFAGADPERLNHFKQKFDPKEFDFGTANYRSNGTDIARFGNDVLAGKFSTNKYAGIGLVKFAENPNQAMAALKGQTLQTIERLRKAKGKDWALAILVPTKQLMREVSDALRETQGTMPPVEHNAAIDMEGAILAAELIAFTLQPQEEEEDFAQFVGLLSNFFRGKGGDDPSASDIGEALAIEKALQKAIECAESGKALSKNSIIRLVRQGYDQCVALTPAGNPGVDWLAVRKVFAECGCERLAQVAEEARNVRLLDRGTQLRENLSLDWRTNGAYKNALETVRQAFVQEHFSTSVRKQLGVIVMNMHKAKGKQFDEVIIFEGWPRRVRGQIVGNPHRIARGNMDGDLTHATYIFRVSVTRARSRTTIMTPEDDPCILLVRASRAAKAAQAEA